MNHEWHHLLLTVLFQAHGVLCQPVIFDLLHTSPELFQFPFGAAKGLIEELWVMLPKVCKLQVWQEHCCPIFLFQRSFRVNAWHLDVEWCWQHYIWTELIKNLFVNVATLCTPVSCTCQLGQIRVAGSILHGQVCNLPDHGGRKNALDHKCRSLLAKPDWESSGLSRPGAFSKACRFLPDSISICQPLSLLGFSKPIGFSKPQGFSKPLLEIKNKFILSQNLSEARCF